VEAVFCQKCGARLARKPPVEVEIADSPDDPDVRIRPHPGAASGPEDEGGALAAGRPRRRRVVALEDEPRAGGAIVPYRNPLALFGYYCLFLGFIVAIGAITAVAYYFSRTYLEVKDIRFGKTVVFVGFIVGMVLELAAFLLGIFGLLYVRTHPTARGTGHAALSVIVGPILLIAQLAALILLLGWIDGKFQH
jgi:hypothetical protein